VHINTTSPKERKGESEP